MLAVVGMMTVCSCNGCDKNMKSHDYDGVVQDFTAGVDHIQALHRQTMFIHFSHEFEWRNSRVLFNDSIKTGNLDDLKVVDVTDVFQYWDNGPWVQIISSHVAKGTIILPAVQDVWIEDADLNNAFIRLTMDDVIEVLREWNGVIPPATSMSLRLPVGPMICNAQWVIGDQYDVIFIDAVTGEVSNWNPAFNPNKTPRGGDFGKPLGEWP